MKIKSKTLKRFLMLLILIIVVLFIWFISFNLKNIRSGRSVHADKIINNEYFSEDKEIYVNIVNEEKLQIRILVDEDKDIYYLDVLDYSFNEGTLLTEKTIVSDKEKELLFVFLDKEKIYFYTYNKYLYLDE